MVGAGFEFYSLTTNIAKDTGVNMNPIWNLEWKWFITGQAWTTHTVRAWLDNDDMEVIVQFEIAGGIFWEVCRKLITQTTTALRAHRYMRS